MSSSEYDQRDLAHRLPRTEIVDRIPWLVDQCRGRRVVHVGFADTGFRDEHQRLGRWLHGHLADVATTLVGLDTDTKGLSEAMAAGYDVRLADCTDTRAVAALDLEPAEIVIAGEVIEHVDAPGALLDGLRLLCRPDGRLIVTTPNAYGLVNVAANLARGIEINHPDHVVMFTWRTLTELMRRHGWSPVDVFTYVPAMRAGEGRSRAETLAARAVLGAERLLGRLRRPFAADGLIVVAEPTA